MMARTMWLLAVGLLAVGACKSDDPASGPDAAVDPSIDGASTDAPQSAACGRAGAVTGVFNGTTMVAGVARTYIRVVPANYDSTISYPLIFAWHGRTGSAAGARAYFQIEAAATTNAIIVYPQGLSVTDGNPNDTGWVLSPSGRDVALFDALQAAITSEYCVGRTYSMGHSFGGYMSNALACARGGTGANAVRAIAPIAGGGPYGACTGGPISALVIHGSQDMVVPASEGDGSRDAWRTKAGCDATSAPITPSPCVAFDGCDNGLVVRFCSHDDTAQGGHGWPSWAAGAAWQLFQDSP